MYTINLYEKNRASEKQFTNHVVLVSLTIDQFIFWPKLPTNAGFGIKNIKKNFRG